MSMSEKAHSEMQSQTSDLPNYSKFEESQNKAIKSPFVKGNSTQVLERNEYQSKPYLSNANNESRISHASRYTQSQANAQEIVMYEKISQLSERLKNIHHFYKIRIDEQKSKSSERNEVFMGIIEELQTAHNQRIAAIKSQIEQSESDRKEVGYVDQRMTEIKGSIDEIVKQSAELKGANHQLEQSITEREQMISEKERECSALKKEMMEYRDQLEAFERMNLKQNKKNREMLEMIDNTVSSLR